MAKADSDNTISRRRLLATAAPATATALLTIGAAPLLGAVDASDPMFALLALHSEQRARGQAVVDDEEAFNREVDRLGDIEWDIYETPASTKAGAVAKLDLAEAQFRELNCCDGEPDGLDTALMLSALEDIRRFL
jgi:hypothetical protein